MRRQVPPQLGAPLGLLRSAVLAPAGLVLEVPPRVHPFYGRAVAQPQPDDSRDDEDKDK